VILTLNDRTTESRSIAGKSEAVKTAAWMSEENPRATVLVSEAGYADPTCIYRNGKPIHYTCGQPA
jgi:hypothetical protein